MPHRNIRATFTLRGLRFSGPPVPDRGRKTPTLGFGRDEIMLQPGYVLIEVEKRANFRLLALAGTLDRRPQRALS